MFIRRRSSLAWFLPILVLAILDHGSSDEQCGSENIPLNVKELRSKMSQSLHGQPLASEVLYILDGFIKTIQTGVHKTLSLSFHGMPGTGKSYVAGMIASAFFKNGLTSPFVKMYISKMDFPSKNNIVEYQERLLNEISKIVKKCGYALIIFDEVHDMPPGVLDALKPMLDFHGEINGVDYSKAIFIFLSNLGGIDIMWEYYDLNLPREELLFNDFNSILRESLTNALASDERAGFSLIESELIDHFIPFLPLEEEHVEKCIRTEFSIQGMKNVKDEDVYAILDNLAFLELTKENLFIKSGCKMIRNQVSFHISKFNSKRYSDEL